MNCRISILKSIVRKYCVIIVTIIVSIVINSNVFDG